MGKVLVLAGVVFLLFASFASAQLESTFMTNAPQSAVATTENKIQQPTVEKELAAVPQSAQQIAKPIPTRQTAAPVMMIAPQMPTNIPVEEIIMAKVGNNIVNKYGEEKLLSMCSNEEELVQLVLGEVKQSPEFANPCQPLSENLERCGEGKKMCENVKRLPGQESGCPPDSNKMVEACKKRMQKEAENRVAEDEFRVPLECERDWEYNKRNILPNCEERKRSMEQQCSEEAFVSDCVKQYGQQPVEAQTACPAIAKSADQFQSCQNSGGRIETSHDSRGCVVGYKCITCPYTDDELNRKRNDCTNMRGSTTEKRDEKGCIIIDCVIIPTATTPTQQPTVIAACSAESSVFKQKYVDCKNTGGVPQTGQDAQGCQIVNACIMPSPTPSPTPTATPTATPTEASTATPSPSLTPTVTPTASPTPTVVMQAGVGGSVWNAITGLATGSQSAEQLCRERWAQNKETYEKKCADLGKEPSLACDMDEYIKRCVARRNEQREQEWKDVSRDRLCEIEAKMNMRQFERFCKDAESGYADCVKNSEQGCKSAEDQLAKCKEMVNSANVEKVVRETVSKACQFKTVREKGKVKMIDLNEVPASEVIPVVVAVAESIGSEEEAKLKASVEKIEGYYTISGLRIYSVRVKASEFNALKSLPFVKDAKLDHVSRTIESGREKSLDKTIDTLEASRGLVQSDLQPWIEHEQSSLLQAKEEINNATRPKDLAYGIMQFFGMQAQQEMKDAEKLKEQGVKLNATIDSLEKLAQQVGDIGVQAALLEQIKDLKEQNTQLSDTASSKAQNAGGILSMIMGLFGSKPTEKAPQPTTTSAVE